MNRTSRGRVGTLLLSAVIVVLTVATATGYGLAAPEGNPVPSPTGGSVDQSLLSPTLAFQVDGPATNNTSSTIHQENPDELNARGDLEFVRSTLADRLSRRLATSTILLRSDRYERAREVVGPEYGDIFENYISVVDDLEVDARASNSPFQRAGQNQRDFVSSVERYEETYEAYREAKESGNSDRVRRLARELNTIARNVSADSSNLTATYQNVSEVAGYDMDPSRDSVDRITENITERQAALREEEFLNTRLVVEPEDRRISFTDPLVLSGHVETENGSAVHNETLRFGIENRTYRVETTDTGEFTLQYRPTTLPMETRSIAVQYLPDTESVYLGANRSVPVEIEQAASTVEVTDGPAAVTYDDPVNVSGRVHVNDTPARNVPVAVRVGDTSIQTVRTGEEGRFRARSNLSASVRPGSRNINATVDLRGRALTSAWDVRPVRVETTPTSLSLFTERTENDTLRASGKLRIAGGQPVPDQRVAILVEGDAIDTLRTDAEGAFSTNVVVRDSTLAAANNTTVEVVAIFDGTETNLDSARALARQPMPQQQPASLTSSLSDPVAAFNQLVLSMNRSTVFIPLLNQRVSFGILVLAGLLFGAVLYTGSSVYSSRRQGDEFDVSRTHESGGSGVAGTNTGSQASLLETLTTIYEGNEREDAVVGSYVLVRQRLSSRFGVPDRGTHREFAAELAERHPDIDLEALERLTEIYETAAYAPVEMDESSAAEAREAGERLLEE